jgi:hypothetical protein
MTQIRGPCENLRENLEVYFPLIIATEQYFDPDEGTHQVYFNYDKN